jgi:actin beta/gamma 1
VRDIKETHCYVVGDFDAAIKEASESHSCEKNYELPDGRKILIVKERFECPEILFQPKKFGFNIEGIHNYCYDSVMKCDTDVRRDLFANIILSGGSTLFEGLAERMWTEIH